MNPLREIGLVRFKVPSDARSLVFGSKIADEYVQPHIGGDAAFLCGVAKAVLERGAIDESFLAEHAEGWSACAIICSDCRSKGSSGAAASSASSIERIAELYANSQRTIFCWAMGLTHHAHGVQNVQAIGNLALLRGMLGRPGCGLLPLRGHSNVQGIGSMGVTPKLKPACRRADGGGLRHHAAPNRRSRHAPLSRSGGRRRHALRVVPRRQPVRGQPGLDLRGLGLREDRHRRLPEHDAEHRPRLGRGQETIVLPVLARDEEPQPTTQESMFNYVRMSDGGPARHSGPRSEVDVIASLAEAVLGPNAPVDVAGLRQHATIRAAIAKIIPGYEAIGEIDRTRQEFQIGGRTLHEPTLPAPRTAGPTVT